MPEFIFGDPDLRISEMKIEKRHRDRVREINRAFILRVLLAVVVLISAVLMALTLCFGLGGPLMHLFAHAFLFIAFAGAGLLYVDAMAGGGE